MAISDLDIWRAAHLMLKQHGEDAAFQAAQRADALLADGDVEGEIVWKRIVAAIKDLQRREPGPDESVN